MCVGQNNMIEWAGEKVDAIGIGAEDSENDDDLPTYSVELSSNENVTWRNVTVIMWSPHDDWYVVLKIANTDTKV